MAISKQLLHGKITVEHFLTSKEFDLCRQPDIIKISTTYFAQSRKYKKVSELFFSRALFEDVYRLSLTSWHELMVIINKLKTSLKYQKFHFNV